MPPTPNRISISLADRILTPAPRPEDFVRRGKPRWLKMQLPQSARYFELQKLIRDNGLHTVCQEARCPNMGECWSHGVATLMILGEVCTRSCGFCHIATGRPPVLDIDEPRRVGEAVATMDLRFVCITSVNRDELPDGGASIWAETIREVRRQAPATQIEVLIPDFCGDWDALQQVLDAKPDVLNHNLETVPRLYKVVRPQAKYERSIELLRRAKEQGFVTKTGIMVGIGETDEEVLSLIDDVVQGTRPTPSPSEGEGRGEGASPEVRDAQRAAKFISGGGCDILTIGQYLQPSPNHLPVSRFVHPDTFAMFKQAGEAAGFIHVESGPMVRSSYHADKQAKLAADAAPK